MTTLVLVSEEFSFSVRPTTGGSRPLSSNWDSPVAREPFDVAPSPLFLSFPSSVPKEPRVVPQPVQRFFLFLKPKRLDVSSVFFVFPFQHLFGWLASGHTLWFFFGRPRQRNLFRFSAGKPRRPFLQGFLRLWSQTLDSVGSFAPESL